MTHSLYLAITAATVAIPVSANGTHAAGRHLVGIGLFIAEFDQDRRWRFARRAHTIPAGKPESALLEWTSARLPHDAMLIGWNVDHVLVPALLDAAATAPPAVGSPFITRLQRLLQGGVVDVALANGGAAAPPLATVAADMAIYAPAWNLNAVTGAWGIGAIDMLCRDLADEALAIWRTFVRSAGVSGLDAEEATDAWVLRRQRMNAVARTGSTP